MRYPYIINLVRENLPLETVDHSFQVAAYALEIRKACGSKCKEEDVYITALVHDLLEDCDVKKIEIITRQLAIWVTDTIFCAVELLTHDKNTLSYEDYCKQLKEKATKTDYGELAYIVKLADMKDHLSRVDTLTDELKEKYINGLRELL